MFVSGHFEMSCVCGYVCLPSFKSSMCESTFFCVVLCICAIAMCGYACVLMIMNMCLCLCDMMYCLVIFVGFE